MNDQPLATIEFPHGARIFLGKDHRWTGEDQDYVRLTNTLMDLLPERYRPDWSHSIASEIAAKTGAKVIQAVKQKDDAPPGTLF